MKDVTVLDMTFEPEMVGRVLSDAETEFTGSDHAVQVTLKIDEDMAFRAYEELQDIKVLENGTLFCTVEVTDIN